MKRVSDNEEAIVGVPAVPEPVEEQNPPLAIPVEVGHVQVAVPVAPKCAKYHLNHCSLSSLRAVPYSES